MIRDFDEYQDRAVALGVYPKDKALEYLSLKLNGEAGEVAELVGKHFRGDYDITEKRTDLVKELGDVLWYIANMADYLNVNLSDVADTNLAKLYSRAARGKLKGDGDNR